MATKKKTTKSGSKQVSVAKKSGRKAAAKSFRHTAKKKSHSFAGPEGHVYMISGAKNGSRRVHVAKKASAREIGRSIGLSSRQLDDAKSLVNTLERAGLIRKF
jgi:hypothetical protein